MVLDLYPRRIIKGSVDGIWWSTGQGVFLPDDRSAHVSAAGSPHGGGLFTVKVRLDAPDQKAFPIGAQGIAAIYTGSGRFAALRRVSIRAYSWGNLLFPLQ